ncbi:MAG TPA: NlpC/P60 family protein, partial [Actinomycetes bacterium]
TVLLAALLAPLTLLAGGSGSPASAAPSQAKLEAQLGQLNRQADQLVEEYNQSRLALERVRKLRDAMRQQADGAEQNLKTLQASLGARAAAAYVQGAGNTLAAVLDSDDPASAIDRVQVLELLASHDGDLLDRLALAGKAYDSRKRDLAAAEREAAAEVDRLDAKKAEVERAAARTRELLRQLKARSAPSPSPSASPTPSPSPSPPPSGGGGSGAGATAVRYAMAQVGKPYCYGGAGPGCFDCSGLTMRAWGQAGISLPHSSAAQYGVGRHVSASELQPGDLIFYYSPISHVSIYIGNGQRVSATHTGDYVRVQSLGSSIVGYTRPSG